LGDDGFNEEENLTKISFAEWAGQLERLRTHETIRIWSSHQSPCFRLNFAYTLNPRNIPARIVSDHVVPTMSGPLSGTPMIALSSALDEEMVHVRWRDYASKAKHRGCGGYERPASTERAGPESWQPYLALQILGQGEKNDQQRPSLTRRTPNCAACRTFRGAGMLAGSLVSGHERQWGALIGTWEMNPAATNQLFSNARNPSTPVLLNCSKSERSYVYW
jgi:hypothetical protein